MEILPLIFTLVIFSIGVLGTLLPVIPGPALVFFGMVLYGILTEFASLDLDFYVLQLIALIIASLIDNVSSAAGAKISGGSKQAVMGALAGTFIGLATLGPIGIAVGPFVGAVLVEILRGKRPFDAVKIGIGTLIGLLGGVVLKLIIVFVMIANFFVAVF
ncbi:DUF456 domain-containing protein [Alkalibacter saccharofermentans]|uniref:DUF456 domain-containing protein n=1 Tax=Alkalibacter saccharofermentans DSM 14828 TaxID=1120975 RepID=A0A1M4U7S3_9FIRM|nr:DUF456 family protein [Alkalibacter saccharofermentans]SHE52656.1 hypothetical protein SAMN02746064_00669 [Alkalibacter saccharofermentans DSM 14828]